MVNFADVIGTVSTILGAFMYLSMLKPLKEIHDAKTATGKSSNGVLGGLLCTTWWASYGILLASFEVIFCNAVGFIVVVIGAVVYWKYATSAEEAKQVMTKALLILGVSLGLIFVIYLIAGDASSAAFPVGLISCGGTLVLFAAPLLDIKLMYAEKSASRLDPYVVALQFTTTTGWIIYGLLINNMIIFAPNFISDFIIAAQIYLLFKFPRVAPAAAATSAVVVTSSGIEVGVKDATAVHIPPMRSSGSIAGVKE